MERVDREERGDRLQTEGEIIYSKDCRFDQVQFSHFIVIMNVVSYLLVID